MVFLLRLNACNGPDGCGRNRAIVWQADCGCWTFKCLLCGDVDGVKCGSEVPEHSEDYQEEAILLSGA